MRLPIVEAEGLTRLYNERVCAVDDVHLRVEHGEWLAIMGPSGSGKTTLLNLLGCLDRPTGGCLRIDGVDVARLSQAELSRFRRTHVGLVFQQFHLVPYLTALENVMLAQYFHSMADAAEARAALERVGLGGRIHHRPAHLSGGEQQRVCIARALINEPTLVLADEPTGNLDRANQEVVLGLLADLHQAGHALLLVTHDPSVARLADRAVHLDHGRLVEGGVAGGAEGQGALAVSRAWRRRAGRARGRQEPGISAPGPAACARTPPA